MLLPRERIELWADYSARPVGTELALGSLALEVAEGAAMPTPHGSHTEPGSHTEHIVSGHGAGHAMGGHSGHAMGGHASGHQVGTMAGTVGGALGIWLGGLISLVGMLLALVTWRWFDRQHRSHPIHHHVSHSALGQH
jgi:hypothetical protein